MGNHICGIQQVGIGTVDLHKDWKWYRRAFGMDIRIFEDAAEAPLMTAYTGNKVQTRVAALAMNMKGGGGFEIWQYASRKAQPASFDLELGDYGFLAVKMKTTDAQKSFDQLKNIGVTAMTGVVKNPAGTKHFYVRDENGNWFNIVESPNQFSNDKGITGGVYGMVIGVSSMEKSLKFYRELLGFDTIVGEANEIPEDLKGIPGSNHKMRRVILTQSNPAVGPFNPLLGINQLELIEVEGKQGRRIFENRYWGDLGFIHMCFDVKDMSGLKEKAAAMGYPFTVDSANSFDMGKAAGRFGYVEDPDGALIEFVETHKLPLVEKLGWYIDLKKRKQGKSLPRWLINLFRLNRVKN